MHVDAYTLKMHIPCIHHLESVWLRKGPLIIRWTSTKPPSYPCVSSGQWNLGCKLYRYLFAYANVTIHGCNDLQYILTV